MTDVSSTQTIAIAGVECAISQSAPSFRQVETAAEADERAKALKQIVLRDLL